jgi:hypothetical protein
VIVIDYCAVAHVSNRRVAGVMACLVPLSTVAGASSAFCGVVRRRSVGANSGLQ